MGIATNIEWTDASWNPWQGCTKVSPACTNCYMFADLKRYGRDATVVVRSKPPTFTMPIKTRRGGAWVIPPGFKVFTCSWSDWFHQAADPWRNEAWAIIRQRPDVIFQIVTKRTERIHECLPADWGRGYPNVWLIATVENQEWANIRIPQLLSVPAAVRGLSMEPLLGPVDLRPWLACPHLSLTGNACDQCGAAPGEHRSLIDWIIVGGEATKGGNARPMHPEWVRSLRDQAEEHGIAFFFKQWGDHVPLDHYSGPGLRHTVRIDFDGRNLTCLNGLHHDGDAVMVKCGKKAAGRVLDGLTWSQFPAGVVAA